MGELTQNLESANTTGVITVYCHHMHTFKPCGWKMAEVNKQISIQDVLKRNHSLQYFFPHLDKVFVKPRFA